MVEQGYSQPEWKPWTDGQRLRAFCMAIGMGVGNADDQPAGPQTAAPAVSQAEAPGAARLSAEARGVLASKDHDAQEAELGAAEGRPRPPVQRRRSDGLHSRRGAQPPGALDRAGARRACPRPAGG